MKLVLVGMLMLASLTASASALKPWFDCLEYKGKGRIVVSIADSAGVLDVEVDGKIRPASLQSTAGASSYDDSIYKYILINNDENTMLWPSKIDPTIVTTRYGNTSPKNYSPKLRSRPVGEVFWGKGLNKYFICTVKAYCNPYARWGI